ncbi:MAG: InlB B-repeat-containing protein [Eubacteriales bacterium]|nr:InlB B-repeat-containing protein [Eubacteriales bacterium]
MGKIKRFIACLLVVLLTVSLIPDSALTVEAKTIPVKKVAINKGTVYTLKKGKKVKLKAVLTPSNTTQKKLVWSSSKKKVATVSSKGVVTAKKNGTAKITVKVKGTKKKASIKIIVGTPVTAVALNRSAVSIVAGSSTVLSATVAPAKASVKTVSWRSSNPAIASVDANGVVRANAPGTTAITATTNDGTGKKAVCNVTVSKKTFTVSFNSNGGSAVAAKTVVSGSKVAKPANPTKAGYVFAGWYSNSSLTTAYNFNAAVTGNITLYAKWTNAIYTVAFNSNGGSAVTSQSIYGGNQAFRPADPLKEGYIFSNWYKDSALTQVYNFNTNVTDNMTLYAGWDPYRITITLNADNSDDKLTNRNVSGQITANLDIESAKYTLIGSNKNEEGDLDLASDGTFDMNVALEDGQNIFTVIITAINGTVDEKTVTMTYDSGEIADYSNASTVYNPNDERACVAEVEGDPETKYVKNILNLTFIPTMSFDEKQQFIENELGGSVAGYISALDMMQMWLPENLEAVDGYDGTLNTANLTEDDLYAYGDALANKYDEIEMIEVDHLRTDTIFETTTTNDPWNDDDSIIDTYVDDDGITQKYNPWYYSSEGRSLPAPDWWISYAGFDAAWDYDNYYNSDFLRSISVGVVDNGFRDDHEDLNGRVHVISEWDSSDAHGSHVAGTIAAISDNNRGIAGAGHNNLTVQAYDVKQYANSNLSDTQIDLGLARCVEAGAKAVNFSLGMSHKNNQREYYGFSQSVLNQEGKSASKNMLKLLDKGFDFIVVQSAGNQGIQAHHSGSYTSINRDNCYTSWFSDVTKDDILSRVLVVSAVDNRGQMSSFSCGGGISGVRAIAAPGVDILSTGYNTTGRYAYMCGTSMAAPIVTAACGLVWAANEALTGKQVVDILLNNTNGTATTYTGSNPKRVAAGWTRATGGMGILDAGAAVRAAKDTVCYHYGNVVNSKTGSSISNVKIVIHKNSKNGPIVGEEGEYYTNSSGNFELPRLPHHVKYWYEFSAPGYLTEWHSRETIGCIIADGSSTNFGTVALTPETAANEYSIVLTWGSSPRDLDSHLVANTTSGSSYHVYYSNRTPSPSYANLDVDDTSSYGPETITITNFNMLRNVRYAVHDYTNRSYSSSTALANSGATVIVKRGNVALREFRVPSGGGTEWDVFAIDASGNIIPINTMKYCSSPSDVYSSGISTYAEDELKDYEIEALNKKKEAEEVEQNVPETEIIEDKEVEQNVPQYEITVEER